MESGNSPLTHLLFIPTKRWRCGCFGARVFPWSEAVSRQLHPITSDNDLGIERPTDWLNRKQGSGQKVIALGVTTQVPDWLISVLSISSSLSPQLKGER
ncbi:hypothetical protein JOQ06_002433 [Pogonophryne albipinna]|uniref:Uncharacterized protein n=1 Tax=Pogonophryne albipinna TaxID=1090488 RepID=A0AAD6B6R8_9TELE|nr:hypothetical protein JOQ06_002433 [Pogonophryne albipinna]